MKLAECVGLWFRGLTEPEKTVKKLKKEKLTTIDGIKSVAVLGIIIGFIFFIITAPAMVLLGPLAAIGFVILFFMLVIGTPIAAVIALVLWAGIFRLASHMFGGKGNFDRECGLFGILAGMIAVAYVPMLVFIGIGVLALVGTVNLPLYYFLLGLGCLTSLPLMGIVYGVFFDTVSDIEKASLPRTGLFYGVALGIIAFIFMLLMALLMGWIIGLVPRGGFAGL